MGLLAAAGLLTGPSPVALRAATFAVDTSLSYVSVSGQSPLGSLKEQGSGSLSTRYAGTLEADVGDRSIQFPGSSRVLALDSGSWQPLPDGSSGSALANYGAAVSYYLTSGVGSARDIELDLTSGAVALVNGRFDMQGVTVGIPSGAPSAVAYHLQGALNDSGSYPLAGGSASGQSAQGTVTTTESVQVLTIPINYTMTFSLLSANDTTVTAQGQLVATRNLP